MRKPILDEAGRTRLIEYALLGGLLGAATLTAFLSVI